MYYRPFSFVTRQTLVNDQHVHPNFDTLAFWFYVYDVLAACTIFVAWTKIFKYINFNKTMTQVADRWHCAHLQLADTLSSCSGDIFGFSIMFFIVFLAYGQLGYLVLGPTVQDFSTFQESL
jgi:hypothetical protein